MNASAQLIECCGSTRWVALMAAGWPYPSAQALLAASERAFDALAPGDWREAFAAHARIGEPRAGDADGSREQAGASGAGSDALAALRDGNAAYEARFGHVFLIRAAGRDAAAMLAALRERLANSPQAELEIAAQQQREITRLRVRARFPACAGLVLAAGAGTRFGGAGKLLADLHGRPLLAYAVAAACAVPALERVVVVLGARAAEIQAAVPLGRAEVVVCDEWADGRSASLRAGAAGLAGAFKVVVLLGDMPLLSPELIGRFAAEPPRTRATYEGRPGHPVVLGPDELAAVAGLSGDTGARELLAGGRRIECGPEAAIDVDTPADLADARALPPDR